MMRSCPACRKPIPGERRLCTWSPWQCENCETRLMRHLPAWAVGLAFATVIAIIAVAVELRPRGRLGLCVTVVSLVTAIPAVCLLLERVKVVRRGVSICRGCGYDLKGVPMVNGGVACPECAARSVRDDL